MPFFLGIDIFRELCFDSIEVGPEVLGQGVVGMLGYLSLGIEAVSFGAGFLRHVGAAVVKLWVAAGRRPFQCLLYAIYDVRGEGNGDLFSSGEMVGSPGGHWSLVQLDYPSISSPSRLHGMGV